MSSLAPDLFERRFGALMDIGRALLPSFAPAWTDHNAHDPGITLMELLAWVAEAQLYSLARPRRDERDAYAALLGVAPAGTRPARGVIWRDLLDAGSPAATQSRVAVLPAHSIVHVLGSETPTFRPTHRILWAPGRVRMLETRRADGGVTDHTAVNERGGPPFLPFGETAGPRDVLRMSFLCRDESGLLGPRPQDVKGALWAIGVRAAAPSGGDTVEPEPEARPERSPLEATALVDGERVPVPVVSDSTAGLLASGVLLLDMGGVPGSPVELTLELRSPQGSPRPPRTLRIEPNVVPVEQGRSIVREQQTSNGLPDWSFALAEPGLRFAAGEKPVELEVAEGAGIRAWREVRRLSDHGPGDDVYEFDAAAGRVTFGNGVNGRIPPEGSPVFVSYSVCDGDQGGVARNRRWSVAGFEGAFGVNPDPVAGGAAPRGRIEQRREARRRSRTEHALVSAGDLVDAAEALPLLEVARAWVLVPREDAPRTGVVTLVAMRSRPDGQEPERTPETRRWLEAVRRGLVARVPLGTRLVVAAPRYAEFSVRARLEAEAGREPGDVEKAVRGELARRLAIVAPGAGAPERAPGVPVTRRDVFAWIRAVDGVRSVLDLRLIDAAGQEQDEIAVGRGGLPRVDLPGSDIKAARPGPGTAR